MNALLDGTERVVWDWNGTLLDDASVCVEVMNTLLAGRELPALSAARYAEMFRFPVRDYYVELGFDFAAEPFEVVGSEFIRGYDARQHRCTLRDGAAEVIDVLARRGLRQSVLSASQRPRLLAQAERLGLLERFDGVVALDDHYAGSKLEIGLRWLQESGADPDRVLLVGDTDHDVEVARAMKVRCVLVPSGHQSASRLASHGVPVLPSLRSLIEPSAAAAAG